MIILIRRLFVFLLLTLFVITLFSLDMEKVKEYYKGYIQKFLNKSEDFDFFFKEMEGLGLYRFYRAKMIGTAEFTDRPIDVPDYLSLIYKEMKFDNFEQSIAFAGFLAYYQAYVSGENLKEEIVRNLPAYFKTIQKYKSEIKEKAAAYVGNVLVYALGLTDRTPYDFGEKYPVDIDFTFYIDFYLYNGESMEIFNKLIESKREYIEKNLKRIQNEVRMGRMDADSLDIQLAKMTRVIIGEVTSKVEQETKDVVKLFLKEAPKHSNFWWLRFLVYLIFVFWLAKYLKLDLEKSFLIVIIAEIVFLFTKYDFVKDFWSSFFYGVFIITFVLFYSFFKFLSGFSKKLSWKEKVLNLSIPILILLTFMIPLYTKVVSIKMDNFKDFHKSIYEKQLLNDILIYPHAFLNKELVFMNAKLTGEISDVKNVLNTQLKKLLQESIKGKLIEEVVANKDELIVKMNKEGLNFENKEVYRKIISDYNKPIENFLRHTRIREKQFYKKLKSFDKTLKDILVHSDEEFDKLLYSELMNFINTNPYLKIIKSNIDSTLENPKRVKYYSFVPYASSWGIKFFILFFFGILGVVVFSDKKLKYVSFVMMIVSILLSFVKPKSLEILSEYKYPLLEISNYSLNLWYPLILLLILLAFIYETFKKGGEEA